MIGQILDQRYRVLRKLGEGGMGEVWLAEHVNLGRKEALKILQPALAADPQFVSRFRREARATNRVQHPNIVSVYDFGRLPDGRFYLAMEYAHGERLDAVLGKLGALPVARALRILDQLADAVDHAHAHGVVHRDLKPENMVLVEHRGHADVLKVLDFGLAKIIAPDYKESQRLTEKGELFGTVEYMAPEQCIGDNVSDPRTDIYAIGCLAFEMLSGETPFAGRTVDVVTAHLTQSPGLPSRLRPHAGIVPSLDALVQRCLEKDPAKRFQTGKDLRFALKQIGGYKSHDSDGRRPRAGIRAQPAELVDLHPRDFSDEETTKGKEGLAVTVSVADIEAKLAYNLVVREVAEGVLDLGVSDVQLIVDVANCKELENELRRCDDEIEALERSMNDIEQVAREREGPLRFAIGELVFQRSEGGSLKGGHSDLGYQIRELEGRLANVSAELERERAQLTERGIELAAAHAIVEEKLEAIYTSVDRTLDLVLPNLSHGPGTAELAKRLDHARALLKLATQRRGKP